MAFSDSMLRFHCEQLKDISEASAMYAFLNVPFDLKHGHVEEARIRQFYGPADDKVVFWKLLHQAE